MTNLDAIRQRVAELKADPDVRVGVAMSLYDYCHQLLAALEEGQGERERWKKDCDAHLTLLSKRAIELNGKDAEIARLAAEVEGLKATP